VVRRWSVSRTVTAWCFRQSRLPWPAAPGASAVASTALAVLVVATPCPLILAVPIALMGGVNRAARHRIIVKRMAALEVLARVSSLILDKTATITVGRPELVRIEAEKTTGALGETEVLTLAAAVERHSLHPIAKALVEAAHTRGHAALPVVDVVETIGHGIQARVSGHMVEVRGGEAPYGETRILWEVDGKAAATFVLQDRLKKDARDVFARILELGVELAIATGDRRASAEQVVRELGLPLQVEAECTPETKLVAIKARQRLARWSGWLVTASTTRLRWPRRISACCSPMKPEPPRRRRRISRYWAAIWSRSGKPCASHATPCGWPRKAFCWELG